MSSNGSLVFVESLPDRLTNGGHRDTRYDALIERAGVWAEWWGGTPRNVYKSAATIRRDGFVFEATVRKGRAYIRAVPA